MFRYKGTTIPLSHDTFFRNCEKQIIYRICGTCNTTLIKYKRNQTIVRYYTTQSPIIF